MSITSSHYQELYPDFSDLLARHPGLAAWLFNVLQKETKPRAEELLSSFLAECANQHIPNDSYPFSAEDQGLAGLHAYLQSVREWDEKFVELPTPRASTRREEASPVQAGPDRSAPGADESASGTDTPTEPAEFAHTEEATDANTNEGLTDTTPALERQAAGLSTEISSAEQASQENQKAAVAVKTEANDTEAVPVTTTDEANDTEAVPALALATTAEAEPEAASSLVGDTEKTPMVAPLASRSTARRKKIRARRPRTRRQRVLSWALLLITLGAILVPVGFLVNFGINAYATYRQVSDQAHSAVNYLLDVKKVFSGGSSRLNSVFDTARLEQAKKDFAASGQEFQQLHDQLQKSSTLSTITTFFPQYRETLSSALAASTIGIDVDNIGQIATTNAMQITPALSGPLLAASGKPLVTQPMLDTISTTLNQVMPLLNDIQAQAHNVSLDSLPISASEKTQVGQLLQLLPQVIDDLNMGNNLLGAAGWLLGVDHPRTFLVQTMDRAELRGTGGFTGQYGELTINGGRVAPFSLKDISLVEYTSSSITYGQSAPEQYRSWWPFANWGLRDSNISADFPTSAQLAINLYKQEVGKQVDGVISFTPVMIEHILTIIGPIQVPGYNKTVTSQNLEDLLHYYQLNNSGIATQVVQQPGDNSTSTRKRFTNYLATLVMQKVRSASPNELFAIAHQVLYDLKTKDVQVYFANPAVESVLEQYGYAGQIDRSTTHDGLYVVQQNLSASKASQYVKTILHDTVTLDSKGGATHLLQIRLIYNQAGPVYGYDTYYDYLRVYVPPTSQLLSGDGFASGKPLCGGSYGSCPINGVYPNGELVCPPGQYQPGASPPSLTGSDGGTWMPLQTIGGPTSTTSDEPGRAMFGGWVIVPKNCTMNVTLSWYVPPLSNQPYSLLVQRQAGTFPELDLSILPDAANCASLGTAGLHSDSILTEDTSFKLPAYDAGKSGTQNCYPHLGV